MFFSIPIPFNLPPVVIGHDPEHSKTRLQKIRLDQAVKDVSPFLERPGEPQKPPIHQISGMKECGFVYENSD